MVRVRLTHAVPAAMRVIMSALFRGSPAGAIVRAFVQAAIPVHRSMPAVWAALAIPADRVLLILAVSAATLLVMSALFRGSPAAVTVPAPVQADTRVLRFILAVWAPLAIPAERAHLIHVEQPAMRVIMSAIFRGLPVAATVPVLVRVVIPDR